MAQRTTLSPDGEVPCVSHLDRFAVSVAIELQELIPRLLPRKGHAELRDQPTAQAFPCSISRKARPVSRAEKRTLSHRERQRLEAAAALDILKARQ
jgi:hypothetical protein